MAHGRSLAHVCSTGTLRHYPADVRAARAWHLVTAAVAATALVLQLTLVIEGGRVLEETHPPSMGLRLVRFLAYFTVQSNILVLACTLPLARDPPYDGRLWRVLLAVEHAYDRRMRPAPGSPSAVATLTGS